MEFIPNIHHDTRFLYIRYLYIYTHSMRGRERRQLTCYFIPCNSCVVFDPGKCHGPVVSEEFRCYLICSVRLECFCCFFRDSRVILLSLNTPTCFRIICLWFICWRTSRIANCSAWLFIQFVCSLNFSWWVSSLLWNIATAGVSLFIHACMYKGKVKSSHPSLCETRDKGPLSRD